MSRLEPLIWHNTFAITWIHISNNINCMDQVLVSHHNAATLLQAQIFSEGSCEHF